MLKETRKNAIYRSAVVLLTTLVVLRSWFNNMVNLAPKPALCSTLLEILLICLLLLLYPHGKRKIKMEWLLLCYAGWGILTRFLLKDLELIYSVRLEVLMLFEICAAFFAMHDLDWKSASKIFSLVTAILCTILTVWAAFGLIVMLTDVEEIQLLFVNVRTHPGEKCLDFAPVNRNETAVWFMIGLWLLIYQWTVCKRKLWRIPLAFSMLLMYLAIALQRSRTVYIAVAFTVGLLVASRLLRLRCNHFQRYLLMAAVAGVCSFIVYESFSVVSDLIFTVAHLPSLREYTQNRKTVASRSKVWMGEIRYLMHNPRALLLGQPKGMIMMNMSSYYSGRTLPHLHNGFLQVLAMYGLPGLVLLCGFLVALIGKLIRVYFAKKMTSARILSLLLAGLMLDSLMEPVFTAWIGLATAIFMLVAGMLTREEAGDTSDGQA